MKPRNTEKEMKKHIHKRLKGFQFCKCGEYVGIKRKFVSIKDIKPNP